MNVDNMNEKIVATLVSDKNRLAMLPKHFGHFMMGIENRVYGFMREMCDAYDGGYWHYYELSNGGFYMAPDMDEQLTISVESNLVCGEMSADAAGITVCLFAYSHMSFAPGAQGIGEYYHLLRDYAFQHDEVQMIMKAID